MTPALLDTDILSELLKLKNPAVRHAALVYSQTVGPLTFSAVTHYEIIRGYKLHDATAQIAAFEKFCDHAVILPVTETVWERAADLWALGHVRGQPRGDADLLIAATALVHGQTLVSGNTRHFEWIPNLKLANWRSP